MSFVWLLNRPSHLEALQWDQWDLRKIQFNLKAQCNLTKHRTKQNSSLFFWRVCFARLCVYVAMDLPSKCFLHSMLETIDAFNFNILWALGKKTVEIWVWPGIFRGDLMYCKISKYSKYTMYIHYMHPWNFQVLLEFKIYIHILGTHLVFPTSKMEMDTPFASCQVPSGRGKRSEAWALLSVKEPCPQLQPSGIQWYLTFFVITMNHEFSSQELWPQIANVDILLKLHMDAIACSWVTPLARLPKKSC